MTHLLVVSADDVARVFAIVEDARRRPPPPDRFVTHTFRLSTTQHVVVDEAVTQVAAMLGGANARSRALELICAHFLLNGGKAALE